MADFNTFLEIYGLAAIFTVMLLQSSGVPIPIPADALMLATSARAAEGKIVLAQAFIALLIALVVGGVVQYLLVRGPARSILYRYGRFLGMTPARLDTAANKIQKGNVLTIGIAILTPGVRSVTVGACGLAGVPLRTFALGLTLGSGLFLALHFFLGYIGGTLLMALPDNISLPTVIAAIVVLLVVGLLVWYVIRRRQLPNTPNREILAEAVGAWHEATCPVCLALGAAERLQIHHHHEGAH